MWRNITISGKAGAGSTTLFNNLKHKLLDWTFFSGGEYMREYAVKQKLFSKENKYHHKATDYSDEFDKKVDSMIRERLMNENNLVVESDLAGFNARGISGVLKILLVCEDSLRIDRIVNRDGITVEEAKEHLRVRERENMEKWEKLYGTHDFWNPKLYDLVIDTYKYGPGETLEIVLEKVGYRKGGI
ncbi:cytidylate kinase family protein [Candidatus Gottesmanbacteria bacterium]|nr:cytidylate kinase family protein [Candidatus Gottesmanbacteria bacterium]